MIPDHQNVHFDEIDDLIKKHEADMIVGEDIPLAERIMLGYNTKKVNDLLREQIVVSRTTENISGSSAEENVLTLPRFQESYPYLWDRIVRLPFITEAEIRLFVNEKHILQNSFALIMERRPLEVFRSLNTFFGPSGSVSRSSMGSFCSIVPNIFAALNNIQGLFNNAIGYKNQIEGLISNIQNFTVAGLINQLRQQVRAAIDQIIEDFKSKLNAIRLDFMNTTSYLHNLISSGDRFRVLMDKARSFTDGNVIENIRARVEGSVSQAASLFDARTFDIQEIQFLILRFCALIGNLERFLDGTLNPLRIFQSNFTASRNLLQNSGNRATARAISAGALRYTPDQRRQGERRSESVPESNRAIQAPLSYEPGGEDRGDGLTNTARPFRGRSSRIKPATPEEIMAIPSYEQVLSGHNGIQYREGRDRRLGWERVQTMEIVMLMRLQRAWGRNIFVTSAYRSYPVNGTYGLHMSGQAFDISMPPSQHREFGNLARRFGFGGIGTYNTFIHIDSWTERTWGSAANIQGLSSIG
ncbi:MAG: D-Ala-D-Ala carboxypeptidase family metallohydrolase [Anaerolineaceae bacterium]